MKLQWIQVFSAAAVFCGLGTAVFFSRSRWERRRLKAEYYSVINRKKAENKSKGHSAGNRLRLAFISDIHDYLKFKDSKELILSALAKAAPDAVLIGGDAVTVCGNSSGIPDTAAALDLAAGLAEKYTVICAPGNHETKFKERQPEAFNEYVSSLERRGVTWLENGSISTGNVSIYSVELDMGFYRKHIPFISGQDKMTEKYIPSKAGFPDPRSFNILLIHSPLYLKEAEKWGADLVLSGHFHGGTVRLPWGTGLMTPQYQFFNRFCSGMHHCGKTDMIVSRGLGTHTFNIRFNNLPEISIVDIE